MSGPDEPMREPRARGRRGILVLLVAIVVILLAEAALVVAVFVSPSTGTRLETAAASARRVWDGTQGNPGVRTRTAKTAERWFDDWIAPLWRGPETPRAEPEFTACVDCHEDYATTRRFGVYMNHPLHAELGVECKTCHPTNPHPSPPRPREAVCEECHAEVRQEDRCGYCHPPGSLPHFYTLGAPRDASVRCDVCHPKGAFDLHATTSKVHPDDLTGANEKVCLSCHETSTCESCHEPGHPIGWLADHGSGRGRGENTNCYNCHSGIWCADRCHAVTTASGFVPKPLPPVGVRP